MSNTIFVGNLNYSVTQEDLVNLFSPFGQILSCVIIPRKGYGFVNFSEETLLDDIIKEFNGKVYWERPIRVERATGKPKENNKSHSYRKNYSWKNRNNFYRYPRNKRKNRYDDSNNVE